MRLPPQSLLRDEPPPDDLLLVVRGGANSLSDVVLDRSAGDCWGRYGPGTGGFDPEERLNYERQVFFSTPRSLGQHTIKLQRQSDVPGPYAAYSENARWRKGPVVYLTLNVQAATEHLQGGFGAPGLANLDATNNVYGGKVTFQLPHSASSISLSAKQYRYQDNLTPNAYTQTNANLNFTVKF